MTSYLILKHVLHAGCIDEYLPIKVYTDLDKAREFIEKQEVVSIFNSEFSNNAYFLEEIELEGELK